jgi:hypothetical protein
MTNTNSIQYLDFDSFCQMMVDVREGFGVVFCPPLISLYDDNDDDCKNIGIGRDDTDYIKGDGDFDFIVDDKNRRIISYYEEDEGSKWSNDESLYDMKKNEK